MSKPFLIYTTSITFLITAAMFLSGLLFHFIFPLICYLFTWGFAVLTILLHQWLIRTHNSNPDMFVSYFMVGVFAKMMFTLIPLFGYLYFYPEHKAPVALSFLIVYFGFTGFETIRTYRYIRSKND